ncbi:hypothetical protein SAMN05444714_2916 [Yoonia litorea]|uniref:Uncharacterized protein n=1 Tax=Yoonia litorea TaxID=1123755 RepID=A0A1I6N153_9RHOB|nr:hypothetical protein SAMN05444714_2916 [Yoonia litorea]
MSMHKKTFRKGLQPETQDNTLRRISVLIQSLSEGGQ